MERIIARIEKFKVLKTEIPLNLNGTDHKPNMDSGCGRTRRVNWVYFSETWLKILNNLTRLKVGYNKMRELLFMSGRTEMGYEVG